jgi:hypothetical protein
VVVLADRRRLDPPGRVGGNAFIRDPCAIGEPEDVAAGVTGYRAAGTANPMITNITGTDLRPTLHAAVAT